MGKNNWTEIGQCPGQRLGRYPSSQKQITLLIMKKILIVCLFGITLSASAQMEQNWNWEVEGAIAKPISDPYETAFHLGVLLPAKTNYRWHRLSLDLRNQFDQNYLYQFDQNDGLRRDSGLVQEVSLRYGLEARTYKSDNVAIYFGVEAGGAISVTNRQRSVWADGDISGNPEIETFDFQTYKALISPFAGLTVWLSDEIGVFGQLWANNSLFFEDDGQSQTFNFDMTPDLRIGLTLRMPD